MRALLRDHEPAGSKKSTLCCSSSPETTDEQHTRPARLRADRMEAFKALNGDEWGPAQAGVAPGRRR
ncbi:hypothetical protein ABT340_12370 [Streptosporangium sp. NPDC000239]|uniref:hypothetical protein n=1 Tax=Streptosporangium sp. NPDC000239 TaxID=3154248 RepID=UPI0033287D98